MIKFAQVTSALVDLINMIVTADGSDFAIELVGEHLLVDSDFVFG